MMCSRFLSSALLILALSTPGFAQPLQAEAAANQKSPPSVAAEADPLSDARRLIDAGKYDEAIQKLGALEQQHPQTKGLQYQLGVAYYRKGDYAQAQSALARAMAEDSQN